MNKTVEKRGNYLTGIEKLQLIEKIKSENDPQRKVDAVVLATQICMKESRQAKVDEIVEKTKIAMEIYKKEGQQAKVDKMVAEQLANV